MKQQGFLFSGNANFLEELHKQYLSNASLNKEWQDFFESMSDPKADYRPKWNKKHLTIASKDNQTSVKYNVLKMIDAYRKLGHYVCNLDPLGIDFIKNPTDLKLELADFEIVDANSKLSINNYAFGLDNTTVSEVLQKLHKTYCSSIAVEFEHVDDLTEKKWLYKEFENLQEQNFTTKQKQSFLECLMQVENFENYLHTKFPGAKRFSIEGAESAILAMEELVKYCALDDVREVAIGMAHRGRLSTLATIIGKPYSQIFSEFAGSAKKILDQRYSGDVKYHMGYLKSRSIQDKTLELSLAYNPSHLEAVNPVLAGSVRAKQDKLDNKKQILGLLIHGDAAFCGQGVVAESIAMSNLEGYKTYGILHLVINNQIGFTANPKDTRSSRYPTEFAKIEKLPILHVNGDDPEAVVRSILFAVKYRQKFQKDVVVDVFCYRKYGHNEGDEPLYTQGQKYNIIKNKLSVYETYAQKLLNEKSINDVFVSTTKQNFKQLLDSEFAKIAEMKPLEIKFQEDRREKLQTGVEISKLKLLAKQVFSYPQDFPINPKLAKLFAQRINDAEGGVSIDWAIAEMFAFASLLDNGVNIRLSGEDVGRGTFSHRHSVLHSQLDEVNKYIPLNHLSKEQKGFYQVYDSFLSEFAVLGFEYGYTLNSDSLVIWEAQFGDFANGAQTIIDQFISSGESKWLQTSNLVLLLPHGYEGQGPEHSSARIERFLTLAAQDNMIVSTPSSPASYFHLLRRQMIQGVKKPLIIFSPKSLLRHKLAVSNLKDFDSNTSFTPVIDDNISEVNRVIICSGKVYYDLIEERSKSNVNNTAIIRIEQYYPFPEEELAAVLRKYAKAKDFIWCQEEPENMGAFSFINPRITKVLESIDRNLKLKYVGRSEAASPAVGYLNVHNQQQTNLIKQALGI
jgi:2-oxoglutarate dehydrogenase E1 component